METKERIVEFVLNVKVSNNLTVSLPVDRTDGEPGRLFVKNDPGSSRLLEAGQACTLVAANGSGLESFGQGIIRSIEKNGKGCVVLI